jgi:hypothetical protein
MRFGVADAASAMALSRDDTILCKCFGISLHDPEYRTWEYQLSQNSKFLKSAARFGKSIRKDDIRVTALEACATVDDDVFIDIARSNSYQRFGKPVMLPVGIQSNEEDGLALMEGPRLKKDVATLDLEKKV